MMNEDIYPDITEAVIRRAREIEGFSEPARSKISSPDAIPDMEPWVGAWLLIFTFLLITTLAITGLSLLFGGASAFGVYLFLWGLVALWGIVHPIVKTINRWRHSR